MSRDRREVIKTLLLGGAGVAIGGATAFGEPAGGLGGLLDPVSLVGGSPATASVGSQRDIVPFLGATESQFDVPYGSGLGGRRV